MTTENITTSNKDEALLEVGRANMIFSSIKDIAEELEFHPDVDFEAVKKLLSIVGLSTLGFQLTNKVQNNIQEIEVHHA